MAKGKVLTDKQVDILQETVDKVRRLQPPKGVSSQIPDDPFTPEVYVARTPVGGIPALSDEGTGTGTSGSPFGDTVVSYAECQIYRAVRSTTILVDELLRVGNITRRVYNLAETAIEGSSWILAIRDKFGYWYAVPFVLGSGSLQNVFTTISVLGEDDIVADSPTDTLHVNPGPGIRITTDATTDTIIISNADYDDTGTSTSGQHCDAITLTEQDTRCEEGVINIYERTITLNTVNGCLTKSTGSWVLDRAEGNCADATIEIQITDVFWTEINNFIDFTENVVYFNTYDQTLNININNVWYTYCNCATSNGTGNDAGTSTSTDSFTGTSTSTSTGGSSAYVECGAGYVTLPSTLYATLGAGTGGFFGSEGTYPLVWDGNSFFWLGTLNGFASTMNLTPVGGGSFAFDTKGCIEHVTGLTPLTCEPFLIDTFTEGLGSCAPGGISVTITE